MPLHRLRREVDQVDAGVRKIERAAGQPSRQSVIFLRHYFRFGSHSRGDGIQATGPVTCRWFAARWSSHVFEPKRSGGRVGYVAAGGCKVVSKPVMRGFTAQHAPMPSPAIMGPPDKRPSEAA